MQLRLKSVSPDLCTLVLVWVEEMEVGLVVGLIWVGKPAVAPQVEMILFGSSLPFPPCRQVLQALSCQGGPRTAVVQPEALLSPEA